MFYCITKLDGHKPHSARPNDNLLEQFKEQLNDIKVCQSQQRGSSQHAERRGQEPDFTQLNLTQPN